MDPELIARLMAAQDATAQPGQRSGGGSIPLDRGAALRGAGGFAADMTPILGDLKAALYDAPREFATGHPVAAAVALGSAIPGIGIPLDMARQARRLERLRSGDHIRSSTLISGRPPNRTRPDQDVRLGRDARTPRGDRATLRNQDIATRADMHMNNEYAYSDRAYNARMRAMEQGGRPRHDAMLDAMDARAASRRGLDPELAQLFDDMEAMPDIEQGDAVRQLLAETGERRRSGAATVQPGGNRASDPGSMSILREAQGATNRDIVQRAGQLQPYTDIDPVTALRRLLAGG